MRARGVKPRIARRSTEHGSGLGTQGRRRNRPSAGGVNGSTPQPGPGSPAHITVLFPFLAESRIDALVHSALADVLGSRPAFDLRFERCGRLPGVLCLVPDPDTQLRQLTEAIADRWPEAPPYGGRFAEIVPHLTIAQGQEDAVLEKAEADLAGRLPFTSHVSSVELIVYDGTKWQERASFTLGE